MQFRYVLYDQDPLQKEQTSGGVEMLVCVDNHRAPAT